ncbi:hypothetical protein GOODEAATRI_028871, partial [Goodea atripinnis]
VPPSPLSVHDRYSSPAAGSAKRRLFGDDPPAPPAGLNISVSPLPSPAKRLTFGTNNSTQKNGGQGAQTTVLSIPLQGLSAGERTFTLIPVQPCDSSGVVTGQFLLTSSPNRGAVAAPASGTEPQAGNGRPRRTGSLALFFRKVGAGKCLDRDLLGGRKPSLFSDQVIVCLPMQVYHLASVRLRDLCLKLDIPSELRGKIWTCFEHALVHCTDLMKERHLDQLLLCCIYIISKVRTLKSFPFNKE